MKKTAYPKAEIVAFMDQLKTKYGLPAEPLSEEELAALAKAKGLDKMEIPKVEAVLLKVGDGGRDIEFAVGGANKKIDVSNSRTGVNIGGKKVGAHRTQARGHLHHRIHRRQQGSERDYVSVGRRDTS